MIRYYLLSACLLACSWWTSTAQNVQESTATYGEGFIPPFDFPIVFSGNFGELRANHFHGGLDFKTGGVTGKPVRALADGYIKRIRVTHGSGYVLDVVYNNGYTTINRHLSAFVGDIARRVEALQYERESWEVTIDAQPDEYPVKAGQVIALSGNTGYSFGPHLHLDVFETATDEYVDPLPFFRNRVDDHTAPRAEGIKPIDRPLHLVPRLYPIIHPRKQVGVQVGHAQEQVRLQDICFPAYAKHAIHALSPSLSRLSILVKIWMYLAQDR